MALSKVIYPILKQINHVRFCTVVFQLGFNVRGGAEHKCGVFISGVCKQHIINRLSSSLPYFKTILIQLLCFTYMQLSVRFMFRSCRILKQKVWDSKLEMK